VALESCVWESWQIDFGGVAGGDGVARGHANLDRRGGRLLILDGDVGHEIVAGAAGVGDEIEGVRWWGGGRNSWTKNGHLMGGIGFY
jgi:hypothetical protein